MFNISTTRKNRFDLTNFFQDIIPDNFLNNRMMKLDIKENPDNYQIEVEIPGVNKENINVSVNEDILTISVNKMEDSISEGQKYLKKERKYGEYKRSFSIPDIDANNISAQYINGILKLTIKKLDKEPSTIKYIDIE